MPMINGKYYSEQELADLQRVLQRKNESSSILDSSFVTSAVVGAVTGSTVIGALVGGNIIGGLLGDMLEGSDDSLF